MSLPHGVCVLGFAARGTLMVRLGAIKSAFLHTFSLAGTANTFIMIFSSIRFPVTSQLHLGSLHWELNVLYLFACSKEGRCYWHFYLVFPFPLYLNASYQKVRQNLFSQTSWILGQHGLDQGNLKLRVPNMKLTHYVSSNISLPKKSQLSLELLWSLWQWNSVTEQSVLACSFPVPMLIKCPFVANRERAVVKITGRWRHRVHISALTVASTALHCAVIPHVGCPACGCTWKTASSAVHKHHFRKLGQDFGDKREEMDLHCFSGGLACFMFTAFVVVSVVVLRILKFSNSVWQDLRFYFPISS